MIRNVEVNDIHCFGAGAKSFSSVGEEAFVYGPNGSGKTSIALEVEKNGDPDNSEIFLYNQVYIDGLLRSDTSIQGVFTIVDGTPEQQSAMERLNNSKDGIPYYEKEATRYSQLIEDCDTQIASANDALAYKIWDRRARKDIHELGWAFSGTHGSRHELRKAIIDERQHATREDVSIERLIKESELLRAGEDATLVSVDPPPPLSEISEETTQLFKSPLTSASDTPFSEFVDQLGNRDWISRGLEYFHKSNDKCPFCQLKPPSDLQNSLNSLFDHHYKTQEKAIKEAADRFKADHQKFKQWSLSVDLSSTDNAEEIRQAIDSLQKSLDLKLNQFQKKVNEASEEVELLDVNEEIEKLQLLIRTADEEIEGKRQRLANREEEEGKLERRIRDYYITHEFADPLNEYDGALKNPTKTKDEVQEKLAIAKTKLEALEAEREQIITELKNPQSVVRKINKTLGQFGFFNFKLEGSAVGTGDN